MVYVGLDKENYVKSKKKEFFFCFERVKGVQWMFGGHLYVKYYFIYKTRG